MDIALGESIEYGRVDLDLAVEEGVKVSIEYGGVIFVGFRYHTCFRFKVFW